MSEVLNVLKGARALLENPMHWVKSKMHVPQSDGHVAHCMLGAIEAAANSTDGSWHYQDFVGCAAITELLVTMGLDATRITASGKYGSISIPHTTSIVRFNDALERRHSEVLAVFNETIERLEAKEATKARQKVIDELKVIQVPVTDSDDLNTGLTVKGTVRFIKKLVTA